MNIRERFKALCDEYRETFDESAPVYAIGADMRVGCRLLQLALDRGSPLTLEEVYGKEVAEGRAVAAPQDAEDDADPGQGQASRVGGAPTQGQDGPGSPIGGPGSFSIWEHSVDDDLTPEQIRGFAQHAGMTEDEARVRLQLGLRALEELGINREQFRELIRRYGTEPPPEVQELFRRTTSPERAREILREVLTDPEEWT